MYWVSPVPSPVIAIGVVAVHAGGEQPVADRGQVAGVDGRGQPARRGGGQRVEVERVHVVDVDGGAHAGQRDAGVGGHRGRARSRPGTTSNGTAVRATAWTSLTTESCSNGSPATRCTARRPDRAADSSTLATSPGTPSAGLNWVASAGSAGVAAVASESSTARLGPDPGQQRVGHVPVVDHVVRAEQRVVGAAGQQPRVAGSCPDEADPADGLTGTGHACSPST